MPTREYRPGKVRDGVAMTSAGRCAGSRRCLAKTARIVDAWYTLRPSG